MAGFWRKALGTGMTALGAASGSPEIMRTGMSQFRPNQVPTSVGNPDTTAVGILQPAVGGSMTRPTLFAPGAKAQIDATGIPQGPGFKFPSTMQTGIQGGWGDMG